MALGSAVTRNADQHARDLAPVLDDLARDGVTSLRGIAVELNERGMRTLRGGRWHASNVRALKIRLQQSS